MSVASEIARIKNNIAAAYDEAEAKGATMPAAENSANLADTVASIPTSVLPIVDATYSQQNAIVTRFLNETSYSVDDYSYSDVMRYKETATEYRKDIPSSYSLDRTRRCVIADGYAEKCLTIDTNAISNITPDPVGGIFIAENNDGSVAQIGRLIPTGSLRMIGLPSCGNVRDLGGWNCDGGKVKYGLVFRGSKFAGSRGITISENDKAVLKKLVGIRTDIDFQLSSEGGARESSALGEDIEYISLPSNTDYTGMVNLGGDASVIKSALLKVIYNAKKGIPTYFHCFYGADRTGTLACVIESILGLSQSDIDKDYELTTFSGNADRPRTYTRGGVSVYRELIEYLYSFGKSNLRDNVVKWALRLGISVADLNTFRRAMIDGNPADLTVDQVSVSYSLTNASLSYQPSSTPEYDSFTTNIIPDPGYTLNGASVQVTMNNIDITAEVYSNGVITIPTVTGNVAVSVAAASVSRLPTEYQEVEYIENTSTAWIDTGIVSKYGIRTKVGASITTTGSYQAVIAAYGSVRDNVGFVGLKSWWAAPNAATAGSEITLERAVKYHIDCVRTQNGCLSFDSLSAGTNAYTDFTNTVTYGLFARNKGTTCDYCFKGKVYYCEIYDGNDLVANMIPCYRKSDNKAGMYDIVRSVFLTSQDASAEFSAG